MRLHSPPSVIDGLTASQTTANPDLPERLRLGLPLTRYDRATFYGGDARGYIDYTFHSRADRPIPVRNDA
jgi:hypothetical protein